MSERLSGAAVEINRTSAKVEAESTCIDRVFANLPVANEVKLDFFSHLVINENPDELRIKIVSRYLDLCNLRKSKGFAGHLIIDYQVALAIFDDQFYDAVVQSIEEDGDLLETAYHETGHGAVAEKIGWKAKSETIERGPGYLGLTISSPNRPMTFDEWALGAAAIAYGGAIAVQMMGYKVRGHGVDMVHAKALARLVAASPYSRYSSEDPFLRDAQDLAHSALSGYGQTAIRRMTMELFTRKTIVQ